MKKMRHCLASALAILIVFGCLGCRGTIPTVDEYQSLLTNQYDKFENVVLCLASSEYDTIFIDDASGEFFTGSEYVKIEDEVFLAAVKNFFNVIDCNSIEKKGDTIIFDLWNYWKDQWGGIAYTFDPTLQPSIDYQSEVSPLTPDGWYYYLCIT